MLPNSPVKKILVFVDGSEECVAAAQYAIILAKTHDAQLNAVYVVNVGMLEELVKARIFIKMEEMDYQQDLEQDGKRYLHYISEMAKSKGVDIQTELVKGVVNKEVIKRINDWDIDLLVMGEMEQFHSRTDTYHDEAEIIFRKAGCSVLVVKDPERVERIFESLDKKVRRFIVMRISDLLNVKAITVSLGETDKEKVIRTLIDLAVTTGKIHDRDAAFKAVMDREKLMSTGLAEGVAVPHAKTSAVKDLVLALGVSKEGIDFSSADGKPSHLFFLLLAPTEAAAPNIQALAQIARLTGNSDFCETLKKAVSSEDALEIIRRAEK